MAREVLFRWTRGTVWIPEKRRKQGAGIQAQYFSLKPEERPPAELLPLPEAVPVGLKVYCIGDRDTRDTAYRMQTKLARHLYAPRVFGKWKVYRTDGCYGNQEHAGWALLTEEILVGEWQSDQVPMRSSQAREYLCRALPRFGDMHEGNFGWNPRCNLPQVIDMGDHGVKHLKWVRVPGASYHANRVLAQQRERAAEQAAEAERAARRRPEAHARRKRRGVTHCRTCQATLNPSQPRESSSCVGDF